MRQRWSRILLSIAAAIVLALSLTGVGIEVASSRLEGNITAVDISATTGREHTPLRVVDDEEIRALTRDCAAHTNSKIVSAFVCCPAPSRFRVSL